MADLGIDKWWGADVLQQFLHTTGGTASLLFALEESGHDPSEKIIQRFKWCILEHMNSCPNVVVFCLWGPERGTFGSATAFSSSGANIAL